MSLLMKSPTDDSFRVSLRAAFRLSVLLLSGLLFPGVLLPGPAEAASLSVKPGSVVRWAADGAEACSLDGERWAPLDGVCLYPVGLRRTKPLELGLQREGRWVELTAQIGEYPYPVQRLTIKDDGQVNLSKESLERVGRENQRIGAVFQRRTERRFRLPLAAPLEKMPEGGRFGSQRIMNGVPKSPHSGADYAASPGTPVMAVADGTVALAEEHFFGGKSVFIDHGDRLASMYLHLNEMTVAPGEEVRRGQVIGKVGSTGRSTGPHLHLGFRWRGARIDPAALLGPVEGLPEVGGGSP